MKNSYSKKTAEILQSTGDQTSVKKEVHNIRTSIDINSGKKLKKILAFHVLNDNKITILPELTESFIMAGIASHEKEHGKIEL